MGIFLILFIIALYLLLSKVITFISQTRKSEEIYLKIDNPYKLGIKVSSLLVLGLTIALVFTIIIKEMDINDILSNLFWLTLAYYFFLPQIIKKRVTDKGIIEFYGFLKWDMIKSYKWSKLNYKNRDIHRLEIILKNKKRRHKKIFMFIEDYQKKELNNILRKYV